MNRKSNIRLGPGAPSLILIFVVLSLSILGMLSLTTANNDLRFSRRTAEAAEAVYALRERAEERRASIAALYTEGGAAAVEAALAADSAFEETEWDGESLSWAETDGVRTLHCALRLTDGLPWAGQRLTTEIGGESAAQRREAAILALEDAMTVRKITLDSALTACAAEAADWADYLARVDAALAADPLLSGITRDGDLLRWEEGDGTYAYACEVRINPLGSERPSDFTGVPELVNVD